MSPRSHTHILPFDSTAPSMSTRTRRTRTGELARLMAELSERGQTLIVDLARELRDAEQERLGQGSR